MALDLFTLLLLVALLYRFITRPLIVRFGDSADDTHGSARFATNNEIAPPSQSESGLLMGRNGKTGKLMRYSGPAHLPTRTGKGGTHFSDPAHCQSLCDLRLPQG